MKSNAIRNVLKTIRVGKKLGVKASAEFVRRKVDSKHRQKLLTKRLEVVKIFRRKLNHEKLEMIEKRKKIVEGKLRQMVTGSSANLIRNKAIQFLRVGSGKGRRQILRQVYDIAMQGNLKTPPIGRSVSIDTEDLRRIKAIFSELVRIEKIKTDIRKKESGP